MLVTNEKIENIFSKRFLNETPNLPLFHYTDLNALCSILINKKMRFTYIKHSNDGDEFTHGMNLFIGAYEARRNEFPMLANDFLNFLKEERNPTYKPYVLCLSELGDSLGQWRGYANFGRGASIEFKNNFISSTGRHVLKKVIYNHDQKLEACNRLLDDLKIVLSFTNQENFADLFPLAVGLILVLASTFKSDAFAEEKEWRWIYFPEPTTFKASVRCKNNERLILYVDEDFNPSKIISIALGPDVNKRGVTCDALNELMEINKCNFEIKSSSLSFYN